MKQIRIESVELEPEVREALAHFRQNVDAWSQAAVSRPRTVTPAARVLGWRLAVSAAFGCLLVAGSLTVVVTHHRGSQQARQPVAPPVQMQTTAHQATAPVVDNEQAEAAARDVAAVEEMLSSRDNSSPDNQDEQADASLTGDEQLLAAVDKDLKRPVPRVMEPLAQLAEDDSTE